MNNGEYDKSLKSNYCKEERPGKSSRGGVVLFVGILMVLCAYWFLKNESAVRQYPHENEYTCDSDEKNAVDADSASDDEQDFTLMPLDSFLKEELHPLDTLSNEILVERIVHDNAVDVAQRLGLDTSGTTEELFERILNTQADELHYQANKPDRSAHGKAVQRAEHLGISSEGTTEEILERIEHDKAVKWAQSKGVSTEGTTKEITDRIIHADAVEWAQKKGVSTEGTTEEILERIHCKDSEM